MANKVATTHRIPTVAGDCTIECRLNAEFVSLTDPDGLDEPIVTMLGDPAQVMVARSLVLVAANVTVTDVGLIPLGTIVLSTGALQLLEQVPCIPRELV